MAQTIGSLDLNAFSDLYSDSTQYFWFEGNASATYGAGVHITLSPDTSFIANPTGQNILMNTDGISIRNGLLPMMVLDNNSLDFNVVDTTSGTCVNVASFGTTTRIGQKSETHVEFEEDSFVMFDSSEDEFAHIGSPEGAYITDTYIYLKTQTIYWLSDTPTGEVTVKKNGSDATSGIDYVLEGTEFRPRNATFGDEYEITFIPATGQTKYYTFGKRNGSAGNWSLAEGYEVTANGAWSHAEGKSTKASGQCSHAEGRQTFAGSLCAHAEGSETIATSQMAHAEGWRTEASGLRSHAEGEGTKATSACAHAEGTETVASGGDSHAEGSNTVASGASSHAGGAHTIAGYGEQTVIGRYNDNKSDTVFEIGNGSVVDGRSNAFTVDWNGNVKVAGNFYATDHTNPIGWYDAHNNTTTLSSGTSFVKLSNSDITLAAGRYIITGSVRFNGATSGYRGITIQDSNGSIARANVTQQTIPSSSWTTSLNTTIIYIAQSQTTVSLMAYQNSGSSLGISWDIYAICIK